jgi:hypothetical protein
MDKLIRTTRLVREIGLLAVTFLKVVELVVEIVSKTVNCKNVSELRLQL